MDSFLLLPVMGHLLLPVMGHMLLPVMGHTLLPVMGHLLLGEYGDDGKLLQVEVLVQHTPAQQVVAQPAQVHLHLRRLYPLQLAAVQRLLNQPAAMQARQNTQ